MMQRGETNPSPRFVFTSFRSISFANYIKSFFLKLMLKLADSEYKIGMIGTLNPCVVFLGGMDWILRVLPFSDIHLSRVHQELEKLKIYRFTSPCSTKMKTGTSLSRKLPCFSSHAYSRYCNCSGLLHRLEWHIEIA